MKRFPAGPTALSRLLPVAVVAVLLTAGAAVVMSRPGDTHAAALLPMARGIYEGDDVRIMGVKVGEIDEIRPQGDHVRVEFHYDSEYRVPADVEAAVISPSLVTTRYLQLSPAYTRGAVLADEAVIPQERTHTPVEFDEIKGQLIQLASALGPRGADKTGSLGRLLDTTARYEGQGRMFRQTVEQLSLAVETLSNGRGDLFTTVRNLQIFVTALRASEQQIVEFNRRFAAISHLLSSNRQELAEALSALDAAAGTVRAFVRQNAGELNTTVRGMGELSRVIARQREPLRELLHIAPTALGNFYNIYDPVSGSLTGSMAATNFENPAQMFCSAAGAGSGRDPEEAARTCARYLGPLLDLLATDYPPVGVGPRGDGADGPGRARGGALPHPPLTSPSRPPSGRSAVEGRVRELLGLEGNR